MTKGREKYALDKDFSQRGFSFLPMMQNIVAQGQCTSSTEGHCMGEDYTQLGHIDRQYALHGQIKLIRNTGKIWFMVTAHPLQKGTEIVNFDPNLAKWKGNIFLQLYEMR